MDFELARKIVEFFASPTHGTRLTYFTIEKPVSLYILPKKARKNRGRKRKEK
jgi:hypothetical protein